MKTSKNNSSEWGKGGIVGGKTKYDQINIPNKFTIHPENGLNRHKSNVQTDKPYDDHIK